VQLRLRLLRDDVEIEQRVVTTEFDSVVHAGRLIKDMIREGGTSQLTTVDSSGYAIINWSKITIAYVEPVR
jgi:hypothetical protein